MGVNVQSANTWRCRVTELMLLCPLLIHNVCKCIGEQDGSLCFHASILTWEIIVK